MPATFRCSNCGCMGTGTPHLRNGYAYCGICFARHYIHCAGCGDLLARYAGRHITSSENADELYCSGCWREAARWAPTCVDTEYVSTRRTGSPRCFGVELETSYCFGHEALKGKTSFGVKEDGSINGLEFISPILSGDQGLAEVEKFCDLAAEKEFAVDADCGYHLHVDMRDTTNLQRRHTAYAYRLTYNLWASLVKKSRRTNTFCGAPEYDAREIRNTSDFDNFVRYQHRYQFVNLRAYRDHTTFELRGYQGTLDKTEICNWIAAHLRFVEFVKDKTFEEIDSFFDNGQAWTNLRRCLGARLARYYARLRTQLA